ncbi:gag-pol polyprotein [Cucumis melo var. makuwa]|uniref:Gag-pol polyprotein n=1 Tax=Cucumis melo var. makuwa TaxID=1194695 RepID=A0A5D3CSX7_CUCMM|nr:gag-pol polyprotein [Cucumis melo var. makuwa]TYK14941.1 gag-pol polyprotein [Cucumis melo var. makuwa]
MIAGWEHPTEIDEDGKISFKSELKWSSAKDEVVVGNSRAHNELFNGVDQNILRSRFEVLKMSDDETFSEFNVRVLDIANKSFALGEKASDSKLVRKVLRSLPQRFNMKVTDASSTSDDLLKK